MCGILGVYDPSGRADATSFLENGLSSLSHRGPDSNGSWKSPDGSVTFGHTRLSIIDLSAEGHQPMSSRCGRYTLTYNGEIYNFLEIMEELKKEGVTFKGHSDTEVLLEGFAKWGVAATLNKAIGMFGFALWDSVEEKLTLGRDRVGKKPLYYSVIDGALYFASEIKTLRAADGFNNKVDASAMYNYLTFAYVPSPATIYVGARMVPSGSTAIFDKNLTPDIAEYWSIDWSKKVDCSFEDAVEEADRLLNDAVRLRLRADVDVGCFLSGGIDSGLLTAIASKQMGKPLKTFTVGFKGGSFDESSLAQQVAERYQTDHTLINLSPNLEELIHKVAGSYDQPFADPSAIPSFAVSEVASRHVKVVLNGEGSDELFGGYRRHKAMKILGDMGHLLPKPILRGLMGVLPTPSSYRTPYAFMHRFIRGAVEDRYSRYLHWCVDGFMEDEKELLYKNRIPSGVQSGVSYLKSTYDAQLPSGELDEMFALDFMLNMQNDMLVKMDIATMAYSMEARCPFLDHRLVEWASTLPPNVRMHGSDTKPVLRQLSKRYLPNDIVRAPKRGFEMPLINWLKGPLKGMAEDYLLSSSGVVAEMFNRKYIEDLLAGRLPLDPDRWSRRVWGLLMIAVWDRENRE